MGKFLLDRLSNSVISAVIGDHWQYKTIDASLTDPKIELSKEPYKVETQYQIGVSTEPSLSYEDMKTHVVEYELNRIRSNRNASQIEGHLVDEDKTLAKINDYVSIISGDKSVSNTWIYMNTVPFFIWTKHYNTYISPPDYITEVKRYDVPFYWQAQLNKLMLSNEEMYEYIKKFGSDYDLKQIRDFDMSTLNTITVNNDSYTPDELNDLKST